MGERGKLIAQGQGSTEKIDKKISELIADEHEREKMSSILSAYVIFQSEEGYNEA